MVLPSLINHKSAGHYMCFTSVHSLLAGLPTFETAETKESIISAVKSREDGALSITDV